MSRISLGILAHTRRKSTGSGERESIIALDQSRSVNVARRVDKVAVKQSPARLLGVGGASQLKTARQVAGGDG